MFKLKLINKPKMIKLKCGFSFPNIVLANLQEKEVIPTKEKQEVIADSSYDGLSKVIVDKIPNEYIIPEGQIDITKNGTYDVTDKVSANVNVPEKLLGTKTITTNGIYKASVDNLDGYSEVEVTTSGVDINEYYDLKQKVNETFANYIKQIPMIDTSQYTSMFYMFNGCSSLVAIPQLNTSKVTEMDNTFQGCSSLTTMPLIDTSNVTSMRNTFQNCSSLITIPHLNTSKVTRMSNLFNGCSSLVAIPLIDTSNVIDMSNMIIECNSLFELPQLNTSKVTNMNNMIRNCAKLVTIPQLVAGKVTNLSYNFYFLNALQNFGGLLNIGEAYLTTSSTNYSNYKYDLSSCTTLTHDSLMNVINGLYDIASAGVQPQQLILGTENLKKLTDEEKAMATNKGWTLS